MKKISLIAAMISILLFSCDNMVGDLMEEFSRGNIICVNQNASGKQTGRGWKDAYIRLQDAIDNAKDGDEIWIAGDYDSGSAQITINKNTKIVGGFDENDQLKGDRPDNSRSRIFGEMGTNYNEALIEIDTAEVIFENLDLNNTSNDGRTVYIYSNAEVTIKNCVFNNNRDSNDTGGSIQVRDSGLNLLNTIFTGTLGVDNSQDGGTINAISSVLNLNGCTFSKIRSSSNGGAVYIFGGQANIAGCEFNENSAVSNGGAIFTEADPVINISNCDFNTNTANLGGTIYVDTDHTLNISKCRFNINTADRNGGAIYAYRNSKLLINKCEFNGNESNGTIANNGGGAIFGERVELNIIDSDFSANKSNGNDTNVGGGAIYAEDFSDVEISDNCMFESNISNNNGGAILVSQSSLIISNGCEFSENETLAHSGGAIYAISGGQEIRISKNCIFNLNISADAGGAIYAQGMNLDISQNCIFEKNKASFYGGAICMDGSVYNISGSKFTSNSSNLGGAVYATGGMADSVNFISNCVLNNNQSNADGGAATIAFSGASTTELNILNSNFYNNISVSGSGGALYKGSLPINVYDSRFISNSASGVKNSFDGYLSNLYLYNTYVD